MSIKYYGIYLAYPPTVDLRKEGLGRHLAMFLKGAQNLEGVHFTIVCPSWTKETLESLFESEQVSSGVFEIVSPEGKPYALKLFESIKKIRLRFNPKVRGARIVQFALNKFLFIIQRVGVRAVSVHNIKSLLFFLSELFLVFLLALPSILLITPVLLGYLFVNFFGYLIKIINRYNLNKWQLLIRKINKIIDLPHQENWIFHLFDDMQKHEMLRMQEKIRSFSNIRAWYCPTSFWPDFNNIKAPRLMCVPDVVLSDFPIGFSSVGGDRYLNIFETIGATIRGGENFCTYSSSVKWNTLVDRYNIPESHINVIHHAPNILNNYIEVTGFPNPEAVSINYCQTLLRAAFQRSTNAEYTAYFKNVKIKFLFYASQFRPNKNILMLLNAFDYLLKKRHFKHKLILTGHPGDFPEINQFVINKNLQRDVIFLHGLSVSELAACYKLADLAVNPTLSEGGCPFTFTEALSVGTPVVMSRIEVTEEILTDPCLQELTFFDPYDWRDCAERIEWAVTHRDELLEIQKKTYDLLSRRTWTDVVREHICVMDKLAENNL